jgi:hypothetical protein
MYNSPDREGAKRAMEAMQKLDIEVLEAAFNGALVDAR